MIRKSKLPIYRKMMLARLAGMTYAGIAELTNHSVDQVRYIVDKQYRERIRSRYKTDPVRRIRQLTYTRNYQDMYINKKSCRWPRRDFSIELKKLQDSR